MRRGGLFLILLLPFLLSECGSRSRAVKSVNMAYLYQQDISGFRPNYHLYRPADDKLQVFFVFQASDLLFSRKEDSKELQASVRFTYRLLASVDDRFALDTGSVYYNDIYSPNQNVFGSFNVDLSRLPEHADRPVLVITSVDVNRNFSVVSFEKIQNLNRSQQQNWMLYKDGKRALATFIPVGSSVLAKHRDRSVDLWVDYFDSERFNIAMPPFSVKETFDRSTIIPDSTFRISAGDSINLSSVGMYHIKLEETSAYGLSVFSVEGYYPLVTRRNELVGPMRYITTRREYAQLVVSQDPAEIKKAVDRFWLERGKTVDRGQYLIAAFYGRIEQSNQLFSSYKEGWKTDRGLIYTIFGPPNIVTNTVSGERWVYGEENAYLRYVFNFQYKDNPFSDNDYELIRDENYRYGWGLAIEAWRLGKVYNVKDIKREQDEREQQIRLRQQPFFWY